MWIRSSRAKAAALAACAALCFAVLGTATAEALTVRWKSDRGDAFMGDRCGEVDTVTRGLRRGAFRIRIDRPTLGTLFRDDATGKVVARLTKTEVRRRGSRRSVLFSATGAGDVCTNPAFYETNGWSTEEIRFLIRYRTRERVYFPSSCNEARYKPRRIVIACGDGNYQLRGMHWRSWNGRVARGRGFARVNDCIPYCARGHFHLYRVRARLSRPRNVQCGSHRRFTYRRIRVLFTGRKPRGFPRDDAFNFRCARSQ
jgi:hypothetical protein